MNKFLTKLQSDQIIIGDGAMGTILQQYGLKSGEIPENWNLEHPDIISKIHQKYIKAGAQLIETNTFGGNFVRLKEANLEDEIKELNTRAIELAKNVANKDTIISASIGPTGKMIAPLGVLSKKQAYDSYKKQIAILVENQVDVIQIETMVDLNEIEQALKAAKDFEIPVIAQMNFQESGKTVMGCSIAESVDLLEKYEADVIGINCTPGADKTLPLIKEMSQFTNKPLSVFPNAGEPQLKKGKVYYPQKPEDFKPHIKEFINNNVKIIGGCCGTNPEFITAIKEELTTI